MHPANLPTPEGHALLLAALLNDQPLPAGRFRPEPWPLATESPATQAA